MPRSWKSKKPSSSARVRPQVESLEERQLLDAGSGPDLSVNQLVVAQLYLDLFQRSVDPTGLAAWTRQLDNGTAATHVVQRMEGSPEYRVQEVQNAYASLLGRPADANGLMHYVQLLGQGWSVEQVRADLLESGEYFQSRSGNQNTMFVTALYHDLLGRDVDSTSVQAFVDPLANGLSRAAVVLAIMTSGECTQREVNLLYEKFLFRWADDAGLQQFAQAMQQGTSVENVTASILGSDEYFANSTSQVAPQDAQTQRYHQVSAKLLGQFLPRPAQPGEVDSWTQVLAAASDAGHPVTTGFLQFLNSREVLQTWLAKLFQKDVGSSGTLTQIEALPDVAAAVKAFSSGADFADVRSNWLSTAAFYKSAGGADPAYTNKIYQVVLERAPSINEIGTAANQSAKGTRKAFVQGLLESQEAAGVLVTHWLADYLGRGPAPADIKAAPDFDHWAKRLQTYRDPLAVLAEILGTQDYLGFPPDLYVAPSVAWAAAPGPFAQPVAVQRGTLSTFHAGDPVLTTTYFYWYDYSSGTNVFYPDGASALTHHPADLTGLSYLSQSWHAQQLTDMAAAGIDVALPVAYTTPFSDPNTNDPATIDPSLAFADLGLPPLVAARHQLVSAGIKAPYLGMFYDTTSLSAGDNSKHYQVDLRTLGGKLWFYEAIRNFFSHIPAEDWARIDGKPLIYLYHLGFAAGVDENLIGFVRALFQHDFGVDCYLVAPDETLAPGIAFSAASQPWVTELSSRSAFTVLGDLLGSDSFYTAAGGTNSGLVQRLYDKLLNRSADAGGQALWLNALQIFPRRQVVQAFLFNNESLRNLVAGWYATYLRRLAPLADLAASPEMDSWVSRFKCGEDPLNVLAVILSSTEFYTASGNSDAALVDNLYQRVLLRVADASGQTYWLKRLNDVSREQMIREFVHTGESYQVLVGGWLRYFLGYYYPGRVEAQYSWGGALAPAFRDVAAIGPGYDQSAARGRSTLVVARNDGDLYRQNWTELLAMNPRPWLVHLETWDEFIEGSDIAETQEFGRLYINLTRQFADQFHSA